MLFETLEVPETLLAAQDEGKLVVFAGAGVSMGPPSNLPSFVDLTAAIAKRSLRPTEKRRLDHFLGELKAEGRDVHSLAAQALSRSDSKPTPTHEQLMRLFARPEDVRIVTTNFDPHFRTVALHEYPNLPIYAAPALPRGGSFHGVVHLHGAISGKVEDLVLTDADFGRAYLTEGWARVFLEQLFARYYVLFVGYSHTDPPVHYIARGLPDEVQPRRFVLTPDEPNRWRHLGITVIQYPLGRGRRRFDALKNGLSRWADVTRGSSFWLEDQVTQIVTRPDPTSLTAAEANLLEWCVTHSHTVPFFGRSAQGLAWVEWLGTRRLLAPYFEPQNRFESGPQRQMAVWLADRLLNGPHDQSFEIIRRHGGHLSRDLHRWMINQLGDRNLPVAWTFLLAQETDPADEESHCMLGEKLRHFSTERPDAFWALLRTFTDPRLELDTIGFAGPDAVARPKVAIRGHAAVLWSAWRESLQLRMQELARPMLDLLLVQLERAIELAIGVGSEEDFNRYVIWGRFRIADIEHEYHRDSRPDVMVDMIVQITSHLSRTAGALPELEIRGWLDSPRSLLRRLGLHALGNSIDVSGATKEAWARDCAARYPAESFERREATILVKRLTTVTERDVPPEEMELPPVPTTLPPLVELLSMESGRLGRTVMSTQLPRTALLATLRELHEAARRDSRLATHELWSLLLMRSNWRQLDATQRDELLDVIELTGVPTDRARVVSSCLFQQDPLERESGAGLPPASPAQAERLFALSRVVWESLRDETVEETNDFAGTDWISLALNDGLGTYHLVRFWMQFVSLRSYDAGHPKLPADVATLFEDICSRPTEIARRARAVLVQDMHFVMARDPAWASDHMLPLFDFAAIRDEAWIAWRPFLEHGRLSRTLALALLPHYRTAQPRLLAAGDKIVGDFLKDVAAIVVRVRPAETGAWMQALLSALPPDGRMRWARLVGREMEDLSDDAQRELWQSWLHDYWQDRRNGRLGGTSMPLSTGESAAMAGWLPDLPAVFPEALVLMRQSLTPDFTAETFPWRRLRESSLPERHAGAFLDFLEFLLAHMPPNRVSHEFVADVSARLPRLAVLRPPLLRVAEKFHQHGWMGARDFRAWILREFPESPAAGTP